MGARRKNKRVSKQPPKKEASHTAAAFGPVRGKLEQYKEGAWPALGPASNGSARAGEHQQRSLRPTSPAPAPRLQGPGESPRPPSALAERRQSPRATWADRRWGRSPGRPRARAG